MNSTNYYFLGDLHARQREAGHLTDSSQFQCLCGTSVLEYERPSVALKPAPFQSLRDRLTHIRDTHASVSYDAKQIKVL